ncbi:MAG: nickel pincer cofactor biosynthesis protein LarB [Planctomycetes bacterium]|nr:nickel pincer cofactor biosynthesis protein LarB [Planctomycetota bacterium]MCB9871976.1 nickel pincer cofactor biosynthesis protein LarB [Planctomycetota bacterium]MCB9889525.1 nickel pincer cofactor biosynthesis protein LarB [Planctomycetota bacterium]
MTHDEQLRDILDAVRRGTMPIDEAHARLRPGHDLGFAHLDIQRTRRCGFPEVVFCAGKSPEQTAAIAATIAGNSGRVLLTRADSAHADAVRAALPDTVFHPAARCLVHDPNPLPRQGCVAVLAAGTSDIPVAEEAALTAEVMGSAVLRRFDVGVAGLHRLLGVLPELDEARVLVAVAGMEGALASVVAGLVDRPVVAVPTSVGYGVHLGGLTPLLAMLGSCAAGVGVVNVDNGFGAGYLAALINRAAPPS